MSAAASRHGRPHAGRIDRPRGYPTQHVPDLPTFPPQGYYAPQPPKHSPWLVGKLGLIICWVGVICLIIPAYL